MLGRLPALLLPLALLTAGEDPRAHGAATAVAETPSPGVGLAEADTVEEKAPVDIREWEVPWEGRPRDPYVRDRSRVWFVGQQSHYVAYLDPSSGEFERYDLEPGTGPHNLIVDEDGSVWYAGNRAAHIGHLDPESGEVQKIEMPDSRARDPHTLRFDHRGDIWFTVQGGNFIGRLDTESSDVKLVPVPTERARPYGIVMDGEGRPYVALLGTYKLATVHPETMEIREIPVPREDARPRRITRTPDGSIWYVDYAQGRLGRYDPASGEFEEWLAPGGADARPYGMTSDDQGRVWFVETGPSPNRLVGFDPGSREFFSVTAIPSGGGTIRNMVYHPPTNEIWFGADTNTIGRAKLP